LKDQRFNIPKIQTICDRLTEDDYKRGIFNSDEKIGNKSRAM